MDSEQYIKSGIEEAYDKYADMLFRLSVSVLRSSHDAQDAVQEVFIRYITKTPVFNGPEHEKAWFARVAVNVCRDILRKNKVREYTPLDDMSEKIAGEAGHASDVLETVTALPEKLREVTLLHYFEGFGIDEIAGILGISRSAVKMRLARSRETLKNRLEEDIF